jgi:hypothetical protein
MNSVITGPFTPAFTCILERYHDPNAFPMHGLCKPTATTTAHSLAFTSSSILSPFSSKKIFLPLLRLSCSALPIFNACTAP